MRVRKAKKTDEGGVRACAEDAYKQYIAAIGKKPAPMVANFGQQIAEGLVYVSVNRHDEVQGFIVFFPKDGNMFLENIAVITSVAGKGIGKRLMAFCEEEARRLNLASVQLYTNEKMIANLSIYPYLGYQETERREEDGFSRVYFEKKLG